MRTQGGQVKGQREERRRERGCNECVPLGVDCPQDDAVGQSIVDHGAPVVNRGVEPKNKMNPSARFFPIENWTVKFAGTMLWTKKNATLANKTSVISPAKPRLNG